MRDELQLYQRSEHQFWTDPHIAANMLAAHLDPATDAASRRPAAIDKAVDWLAARIGPGKRLLDLGCGPGLYAERLARRGYRVAGVDLSANSIAHARGSARSQGLDIEYRTADYLADPLGGPYDCAYCIYCDFGALTPAEAGRFLAKVGAALEPGGLLAFDVFGPGLAAAKREGRSWEYHPDGGFWSAGGHFVLSECKRFAAAGAWGSRHVVVEDGRAREFVSWDTAYEPAALAAVLSGAGFDLVETATGLVAENDFASSDVLFALARRR